MLGPRSFSDLLLMLFVGVFGVEFFLGYGITLMLINTVVNMERLKDIEFKMIKKQ